MNEENITNVIEYIQQNSNQTTETLVQSLVSAGYPLDDIKIGLGRLGLSPLSIPGYTPTVQPPQPQTINLLPGRTMLGLVGAVIILIGVYYLGNTNIAKMLENVPLLGKRPQLSRPVTNDKNPSYIQTLPTLTPQKSPIQAFQKTFNNNTYKITEKVYINGVTYEDLDFIYYTENGFVDRVDSPLGITAIIRTKNYYILRPSVKAFAKVESTDLQYTARADELQKSLIFNRILVSDNKDTWEKKNDTEWIYKENTSDYYIITFNNENLPVKIVSYQENKIKDEVAYTYEPVIITEELLAVPKDYREVTEQELKPQQP